MPRNPAAATDQEIVVELMAEEMLAQYEADGDRRDVLSAELERRHPGANERLAIRVTGLHMTATEAVLWAACEWENCRRHVAGA